MKYVSTLLVLIQLLTGTSTQEYPPEVIELGRIIQWEAETEDYEGRLAVANVVLNRVEHAGWPDDITSVIYQRGQFTPTQNRNYRHSKVKDEFIQIAIMALMGHKETCCENVVYFSRGKASYMKHAYKQGRHWFGHKGPCLQPAA